jgi:CDP-6-deoxy-D-xylo-4-hexulose-3-dehydrase
MDKLRMKELIEELSKETPRYAHNRAEFIPGTTQVLYSGPYWDHREIEMALKALLTGAWLTAGEYVVRFQNMFSKRFNVKYSHMVNSGSSANLVLITALKKHLNWQDGDEIIVSPVGFPTTIAPIVQNNLKPVFVDIEMNTLNFDLSQLDGTITERTKAIFVSPVLGNPPHMEWLRDIAVRRGIRLIGDNCDSLGSKWDHQLLNEFYYAWTASFYPAHHITTGEGGMVCSNNADLITTAKSISWWGRDCYCVGQANLLSCGTCGKRFSKWLDTDDVVDHKYVFSNMGYNLKPLDLQGAIGLAQLEKFDEIEQKRKRNKDLIQEALWGLRHKVRVAMKHPKAKPSWFGVPIICDSAATKESLVKHLESNLVQTRSYFAGNILQHPGYKHLGNAADFPNANDALKLVFFLGCPPHYTTEMIDYIGEVLDSWRD